MTRIDPSAVAAWFAAHPDVEPVRKRFVTLGAVGGMVHIVALCGLSSRVAVLPDGAGADLLRVLSRPSWEAPPGSEDPLRAISGVLGLSFDYLRGFVCGWDGIAPLADLDDEASLSGIRVGHADGRAAWELTTGGAS